MVFNLEIHNTILLSKICHSMMNMKCDKCGNESKYLIRVLSDQDTVDIGTSARGTSQTAHPPIETVWCLACVNQQ